MALNQAANGHGRVAYVNARLIDPASNLDAPGALLTEGEAIADLGPRLFNDGVPEGVQVIDAKGLCLAPGLVDIRVQLREPGEEHKETIATAGAAAIAGGITSMVCLPNTEPVIDNVAGIEFIARRAREVKRAKVYAYAAATQELAGKDITEIGLLSEAGAVAFTDGVRAIASARVMRRALSYASAFGALIVQHPEEPALADTGVTNEGEIATRLGLSGIPTCAEAMLGARDLRLVELTGGRYHVAHVSTAEAVELIRRARARGIAVTCDTAPPYFALNELAVGDYRTFAKLSPPLRSDDDRRAIIAGLRDGTIDAIASDHAPQDQDSKRLPFVHAEYGGIGLETLLALSLELYHNNHLTLPEVIRRLTAAPARILGLKAGTLAKGRPADLLLFDPGRPWVVQESAIRSKSKNTPFERRPVQGMALRTVIDGRTVHSAA
ncbi:MAG: dihydroorotase [Alphaproteobacteria bacterium]|nr:dihydroorotase [Alphaproteobacteria bacterium]